MSAFFKSESVYFVDPSQRLLDFRSSQIISVDRNLPNAATNQPIAVSGVRAHDLAVFGTVFDATGASEKSFLSVETNNDQGLLVQPETLLAIPSLQTVELARKFAALDYDELNQLSINSLVQAIKKRYPNVKPIS